MGVRYEPRREAQEVPSVVLTFFCLFCFVVCLGRRGMKKLLTTLIWGPGLSSKFHIYLPHLEPP